MKLLREIEREGLGISIRKFSLVKERQGLQKELWGGISIMNIN